jgi:tRNA pseudouridine13 synthase
MFIDITLNMHKIKDKPEDFIVEEITAIKPKTTGPFAYFWMHKRNLNTMEAVEKIARALHTQSKFINFAGTKDKVAITKQLISIKGKTQEQLKRIGELDRIKLDFYGYGDERLHLGDLEGNRFKIIIREMTKPELKKLSAFAKLKNPQIINYFGEQRFSKDNVEIGKAILKKEFKAALMKIAETSKYGESITKHLEESPTDYITALKYLPKKLLKLFVNAYQSHLWNETVKRYLNSDNQTKDTAKNVAIPLVGFGMHIDDPIVTNIIAELMKEENITLRDFIIRQLPELSVEGDVRQMYIEVKDFAVAEKSEDTATVEFTLPKGSYATEVIRQIFE